jgi:hypothetical protein
MQGFAEIDPREFELQMPHSTFVLCFLPVSGISMRRAAHLTGRKRLRQRARSLDLAIRQMIK